MLGSWALALPVPLALASLRLPQSTHLWVARKKVENFLATNGLLDPTLGAIKSAILLTKRSIFSNEKTTDDTGIFASVICALRTCEARAR